MGEHQSIAMQLTAGAIDAGGVQAIDNIHLLVGRLGLVTTSLTMSLLALSASLVTCLLLLVSQWLLLGER